MKKIYLFICFSIFYNAISFAQKSKIVFTYLGKLDTAYTKTDIPAKFKQGADVMYLEILGKVDYPTELRRIKKEGKTEIQFIITKDGKTLNPTFVSKSNIEQLDKQCLKIVSDFLQKNQNEWIPAYHKGRRAHYIMRIDFDFQAQDIKKG